MFGQFPILNRQTLIESLLEQVGSDFQTEMKSKPNFCLLKQLDFRGGGRPDYSDLFLQQYYLLRYFYAYFAEYHTLVSDILNSDFLRFPLHIASIGCGAAIDGYAFALTVPPGREFQYTGIDPVNWRYRKTGTNFSYRQASAATTRLREVNLLMFPKSLSDLNEEAFDGLLDNLTKDSFQDKVIIASSMMNEAFKTELERICSLCERMKQLGFRLLDDPNQTFHWNTPSCYKLIDCGCPEHVTGLINGLKDRCPGRCEQCEDDCAINRSPILKTDYMHDQVLRFERM